MRRLLTPPDHLLAPLSEQAPCGPDLEYDPDWLALETLARGRAEQQFGDTVIAAEEPDWADVRERAESLLARSRDLRIAVLYVRGLVRTEGLPGFIAGADLLTGFIDRYWDGLHPALDAEEGNDPLFRLNALAPLWDAASVLADLRAAPLAHARACAELRVRDVEVALGRLPATAGMPAVSEAAVLGQLAGAHAENADALLPALAMRDAVRTLAHSLNSRLDAERRPDMGALSALAHNITQVAEAVAGAQQPAAEPAHESATGPADAPAVTFGVRASDTLASREDAIRLLDKVSEFLERTEPANPAPLLIRRARALIGQDFLAILRELAPEGLGQARLVAGIRNEEDTQ